RDPQCRGMIAALQMYDWPEVHVDTDRFWTRIANALRERGMDAPTVLSRPADLSAPWTDPDLVLGQTCGLPYVSGRCADAFLVGRPVFDMEGANGGSYASALVCRIDDPATGLSGFRGRVVAINEYGSQSGCNALADAVLDNHTNNKVPFFHRIEVSGAHRNSASMVAKGQADIAAIDAVAWALYGATEPKNRAKLRVLSWTRPMPALPYITAARFADRTTDLLAALQAATQGHDLAMFPIGVKESIDSDYDPIRKMAARVKGVKLAMDAVEI
ncbi:MAG: PhnD/SsuA/transferrin family substrate-binding protein, partial [Pseudomonadota bacterium]